MDEWSQVLEKCFKLPPSQAMDRLDNIRYTIMGAANRRSVTAYNSSIVAETTKFQQVLRAWTSGPYFTGSYRQLSMSLRSHIRHDLDDLSYDVHLKRRAG
jgi:hypothetical protein